MMDISLNIHENIRELFKDTINETTMSDLANLMLVDLELIYQKHYNYIDYLNDKNLKNFNCIFIFRNVKCIYLFQIDIDGTVANSNKLFYITDEDLIDFLNYKINIPVSLYDKTIFGDDINVILFKRDYYTHKWIDDPIEYIDADDIRFCDSLYTNKYTS